MLIDCQVSFVTAKRRIAPTAIRKRDEPIVMTPCCSPGRVLNPTGRISTGYSPEGGPDGAATQPDHARHRTWPRPAFYEALGWRRGGRATSSSSRPAEWWSRSGPREARRGQRRHRLAGGWGGVTLAYNTRSPEEVDAVIEEARSAGATIGREPAETFWGGYSGVFIDPDGHPWEVAHNPRWTIEDDGSRDDSRED